MVGKMKNCFSSRQKISFICRYQSVFRHRHDTFNNENVHLIDNGHRETLLSQTKNGLT